MSQEPFTRHSEVKDASRAQEIQETQPMPLDPIQNLHQVNSEIKKLEDCLASLYEAREKLQGTVQGPRSVRSAINILPEDMLCEVFVRCLPEDRFPALHVADAPLLLTIICRKWRNVALDERRLWTRLHIVAEPEEYTPQDGPSMLFELSNWEKVNRNRAAEGQLTLIKLYISRSGSLSLSISVKDLIPGNTAGTPSPTLSYVSTLLPRLKRLLWTRSSTLNKLLSGLSADKFRCLESLRFEWVPVRSDDAFPVFLLAPNLHEVEIRMIDSRPVDLPLKWEQLTRLALFGEPRWCPDIPQVLDLLKRCPRLQECQVAMIGERTMPRSCGSPDANTTSRSFIGQPLVLQHLRKLAVEHLECIGRWLGYSTFPGLTELTLLGRSNAIAVEAGCCTCLLSYIRHNANSLTSMEHLNIEVGHYTPRTLVDCLSRLPRLRSLVLTDFGSTRRLRHYGSEDKTDDSPWFNEGTLTKLTPQMRPNGLVSLTAASTSNETGEEEPWLDLPHPNCLCPLLERFEFSERDNFLVNRHFTLEAIVPFVSGKWEASQKYPGVYAPLKYLTVPVKTLPGGNVPVKRALKWWRQQAGLVVNIAYPNSSLNPSQRSAEDSLQYRGISMPSGPHRVFRRKKASMVNSSTL